MVASQDYEGNAHLGWPRKIEPEFRFRMLWRNLDFLGVDAVCETGAEA